MRSNKEQTRHEVRNRLVKKLWPNGNVPKEVKNIFEEDVATISEKIAKAYARDLLKDYLENNY